VSSAALPSLPGTCRQACAPKLLGALCYIVPGTSFGERNGQHERTAWEWRNPAILRLLCCLFCCPFWHPNG
jgi:hypothetical protein